MAGTTRFGSRNGARRTRATPSGKSAVRTCRGQGQAGLADAAGAEQGQQGDVRIAQQSSDLGQDAFPADQRCTGSWQRIDCWWCGHGRCSLVRDSAHHSDASTFAARATKTAGERDFPGGQELDAGAVDARVVSGR